MKKNKPKYCKCGCLTEVSPFSYLRFPFVDLKHRIHWLNTSEKGQKEIVKAARKAKNEAEKKKREKDNAVRESLKTLSHLENEAKKAIQKWVRVVRDINDPCISCGKTSNRYDGGHYFDAGVYSGLMFHEDNIHKQCSFFCNKMNHGNKANYRIGLVKKIGIKRVEWLEENKDLLRNKKYSRAELISIKKKYTDLLKNNL